MTERPRPNLNRVREAMREHDEETPEPPETPETPEPEGEDEAQDADT
jgi:hypothetical protein